jgi:hypothetical protein
MSSTNKKQNKATIANIVIVSVFALVVLEQNYELRLNDSITVKIAVEAYCEQFGKLPTNFSDLDNLGETWPWSLNRSRQYIESFSCSKNDAGSITVFQRYRQFFIIQNSFKNTFSLRTKESASKSFE